MDATNPSSLSSRHALSVGGNTGSQTHRPAPMPPSVGVRPVNVNQSAWRDVLFAAAAMGNAGIVASVLAASPASPDSSDPDTGDTALMHAAQHEQAGMVQHLLDARATVDQTNHDCLTALGLARIAGQSQVADILNRNGAFSVFSCDTTRQYTPEQQMRINRAARAIDMTAYRGVSATQPGFTPQAASDTHHMNGIAPAGRHGDGKTSRMPEQARQPTPGQ